MGQLAMDLTRCTCLVGGDVDEQGARAVLRRVRMQFIQQLVRDVNSPGGHVMRVCFRAFLLQEPIMCGSFVAIH